MSRARQLLLPGAALVTALAAGLAPALQPAGRWLPAALWHLVFAVGALPMILAAMGYFVPVLTRSGGTPRLLALAPLAALAAGAGIVGFFLHGTLALRLAAPWLALFAVALFAAWLAWRWRRCLGRPNPCLAWYAAALALLALGLLAIAVAPYAPEHSRALRAFHLHINTLGFIGVTALGTLHVLLPTVAGRPDPAAAARLALDLKWSAGGAFVLALGTALAAVPGSLLLAAPLALAGAAAYAWPLLRLMTHAWRTWRRAIVAAGNTVPLLVAALAGLCLALGAGCLHAFEITTGAAALPLFAIAFLLPLVSGAAGQLLPVWLYPGVQDAWHRASRKRLARGARARAALLPAGGVLAAAGQTSGYVIGAIGALWLALAMLAVLFTKR